MPLITHGENPGVAVGLDERDGGWTPCEMGVGVAEMNSG